MTTLLRIVFALAMGAATVWSFTIPATAAPFLNPNLSRILVWHLPCPLLATVLLLVGGWFSFKYLRTNERHWDERAAAANELGYVFCLLTMATGILFSEVQWGTWWQWDPRQTSFLMVLLIYAAYFAVRGAFSDPDRRAANAAAYALAAIIPALFLIYVYPRLVPETMHPNDSIPKGQIQGQYRYSVLTNIALLSMFGIWLYRTRIRAALLHLRREEKHEGLAPDSSHPTPTGVVRPVSISTED